MSLTKQSRYSIITLLTIFIQQTRTMTFMDIWLLLCMGIVLLAVAEYAMLLGMSMGKKGKTYTDRHDLARKIDSWAMKIFIGLYFLTVGTYFYSVYSYA